MFPGGEIRSRDSTTFAGSKRRRAEFEEVIHSIKEHDTPPPNGSAENPLSISSDSDDSESNGSEIDDGANRASPPKRRRIDLVGARPPEYSPMAPLRQTFSNSISDSRCWMRGPTSESGVKDEDEQCQRLHVAGLDTNRNGDHGEKLVRTQLA